MPAPLRGGDGRSPARLRELRGSFRCGRSEWRTTRSQRAASEGSWVTSTSVVPRSRLAARNMRSMMPLPVASSRLPVGSSATRSCGRGARARAIATRCCSPPDSWAGIVARGAGRGRPRPAPPRRARRRPVIAGEFERHGDVLQRRHRRDGVEGLEDDADMAAAEAGQLVLAERAGGPGRAPSRPLSGRSSPAIAISRGGLARTRRGRPDRPPRRGLYPSRCPFEDMYAGRALAEAEIDLPQLYRTALHARHPSRVRSRPSSIWGRRHCGQPKAPAGGFSYRVRHPRRRVLLVPLPAAARHAEDRRARRQPLHGRLQARARQRGVSGRAAEGAAGRKDLDVEGRERRRLRRHEPGRA